LERFDVVDGVVGALVACEVDEGDAVGELEGAVLESGWPGAFEFFVDVVDELLVFGDPFRFQLVANHDASHLCLLIWCLGAGRYGDGFDCLGEFVGADEEEGCEDGGECGGAADPERPLEAAAECASCGVAFVVSVFRCAAVTVDATATPSAPPSCCVVLRRPEASPVSCSWMPASAAIETGMNANAVPTPVTKNGPRRLLQYCP
jgi:hypothetical protein